MLPWFQTKLGPGVIAVTFQRIPPVYFTRVFVSYNKNAVFLVVSDITARAFHGEGRDEGEGEWISPSPGDISYFYGLCPVSPGETRSHKLRRLWVSNRVKTICISTHAHDYSNPQILDTVIVSLALHGAWWCVVSSPPRVGKLPRADFSESLIGLCT